MTAELPGTRGTTVTVGTFDGIHRGHQAVLAEIVRRAREAGRAAVLVTFDPHPLEIVAPERAPALLTVADEQRLLLDLLEDLGVVGGMLADREERRLRAVMAEGGEHGRRVV